MVITRAALQAVAKNGQTGLAVERYFTREDTHPYDELEWELRDAVIRDFSSGDIAFEQRDVEFPTSWSMNATTIVAQKYFRGPLGSPSRERSVRQMIDRVADQVTDWGRAGGYFADEDSAEAFNHELKHLLVHQKAAFNSPVWFNVGVEDDPQCSACFILSVEDKMSSILNWYAEEGMIFKGGSGSGVNLSRIRSSHEPLKGGGEASGPVSFMRGADASAGTIKCLHRDTPITTEDGVVPIGEVEAGTRVLTRFGFQEASAVHDNGVRSLVRIRTGLGDELLCTPEHRFWVRGSDGEGWREAQHLRRDDHLLIDLDPMEHGRVQELEPVGPGHHNETRHELPEVLDEALALWLGWVYGDGSIHDRGYSNFIAVQIGDKDQELVDRYTQITRTLFGDDLHVFADRKVVGEDASASVRFCSSQVLRFLETNGLRKGKADELRVPEKAAASPPGVRAAFLSGLFEADGHVANGYPYLSTISGAFARDVHRQLLSLGVPSHIRENTDRSRAYGSAPIFTVRVVGAEGVRRFAKLVGFVSERKSQAMADAVARKDNSPYETEWVLPHAEAELDVIWQAGDEELRRAVAPYTRYSSPRSMSLLRARTLLEEYPDVFDRTALPRFAEAEQFFTTATVEPAGKGPVFDLTVDGAHEYLVNNVVTHNSGGKTRRAAKMVVLDVDHPDVEEFIWCKHREEQKARALEAAGFDMAFDGRDTGSIQYQNANNSVRVTDEFMRAVEEDGDFDLTARTTGETIDTAKARDVMRQIAQAAWECADPGVQYDTTINDWHTTPNAGRITASNPCFTGETLVATEDGPVPIETLAKTAQAGQSLPRVWSYDLDHGRWVPAHALAAWHTKNTSTLVRVVTVSGVEFRCTPEHRLLTAEGHWVEAARLAVGDELRAMDSGAAPAKPERVTAVELLPLEEAEAVYDLSVEGHHNFAVGADGLGTSVCAHNCSEYMHLDNSACNLASLNLREFEQDGVFDVEAFRRAVEIMFTAQEILVDNSSYPTDAIGANARAYRQLGLGYANLGALLMSQGLAYDSDEGRAWASSITALMTGHAYRTSAEIARAQGPFAGYANDRDGMLRVIAKHKDAAEEIDDDLAPANLLTAARESWADALELGTEHGIRNAQASVLAPTGTIGLMMDCDTTGVEPDLGLVKSKKLVGGGTMRIVNQTVPEALEKLGYQPEQIEAIVNYIDEHATVEGAPAFREEHLPVFDCALGERSISPGGHIRMLGAVQPWLSGSASKTVNMPESATVEDVEGMFIEGWKLGLKAIAIYRDNCKVSQPLSVDKKETEAAPATNEEAQEQGMVRRRLPKQRPSQTVSFQVGDAEGYLTAGEYPGDGLGEIFVKLGKQGSTLSGVMDAFAISVSLGLQYGVPLEAYVKKFTNMRFDPAGMTDDPEVKFTSSIVDYIFRRLAIEYLPAATRQQLGIQTLEERKAELDAAYGRTEEGDEGEPQADAEGQTVLPVEEPRPVNDVYGDAPMCFTCGVQMVRAGSCHVCRACGATSGCS